VIRDRGKGEMRRGSDGGERKPRGQRERGDE